MCLMLKMHKNPIKARFIIASPKPSIKSLARTITIIFRLFSGQMQTYNDNCRFHTGLNTLWVVQNNKPVIDAVNESMSLINLRKQLLFQYLTFLPCILNCYKINFRWYSIV